MGPGDQVLLRQNRKNKLDTSFEQEPYEVIGKQGSEITIQSPSIQLWNSGTGTILAETMVNSEDTESNSCSNVALLVSNQSERSASELVGSMSQQSAH